MVTTERMPTLSFTTLTAPGATPSRWMLVLHGILGSGANWRTFAKRILDARPEWGAALVDLRNHGQSTGFVAPHTLAAASADLDGVMAELPGPVEAVLGHSYGGKVAMQTVARLQGNLTAAWIFDSAPGARPDGRGSEAVFQVLRALKQLPALIPSREAFHATLEAEGVSHALRQWLAMNVRADGDAYRFRIDLDAVEDMLDDYWAQDLWPVLEDPPGRVRMHAVLGGRSSVWSAADRARVQSAAAARPDRLRVHILEEAGHWVHVDDPEGLLHVVRAHLPGVDG